MTKPAKLKFTIYQGATFRKGEIHARNQQEIADAHDAQEKRRLARLAAAAAAADGERLRQQVTEFAATCSGEKPKALPLPFSIAGIEPPPSGFYTEKLVNNRQLKQTAFDATHSASRYVGASWTVSAQRFDLCRIFTAAFTSRSSTRPQSGQLCTRSASVLW